MSVCEMLEDKFEEDLREFLNSFQHKNDCKIKHWSWIPDGAGNYTLQVQVEKDDSKYVS